MEPHPCSEREAAERDTGQSARRTPPPDEQPDSPPDGLTGGAGSNQDGSRNTVESTDKPPEVAPAPAPARPAQVGPVEPPHSHGDSPQEKTGAEEDGGALGDDLECVGEDAGLREVCENVSVTPRIVIEEDSGESREGDSSNDDDLDPLITIDDTESQSSDLINFDTVSYDVMRQHGAEDDDDEKSITTLSSLSCDIKMDSPSKHSQGSNSSSRVNLLDSSVKEALGLAVNSSAHLIDCPGSAASSCPSSPSLRSSKTMSSAVDDSISEAFMSALQITEDKEKIVNCDSKLLSQEDLQSEEFGKMEIEESVSANSSVFPQPSGSSPSKETSDFPCVDLVLDLSGAQEVSSPVEYNLSHSNVVSDISRSPDDSKVLLQNCDGDKSSSESLNVPDNSVSKSLEDDKDLHKEVLVNSSSEVKEPEPSVHLVSNKDSNLNINEEETEVISAVASLCPVIEDPVNVDSFLANECVQSSSNKLEVVSKEEDSGSSVSCQNVSVEKTEVPSNISSTTNEDTIAFENDANAATVSSTEDEAPLSTCSYDNDNLPLVSSTSNEDTSCTAMVVSSTAESVANETEVVASSQMSPTTVESEADEPEVIVSSQMSPKTEESVVNETEVIVSSQMSPTTEESVADETEVIVSSQMSPTTVESVADNNEVIVSSEISPVNENVSFEENISSSTASLVFKENFGADTSEKITNSMDSQNMEELSESPQVVRTPSPADSALSVSNCVTSEESIQRLSCDSSNGTMELISLEANSGDISSGSDRLGVSKLPDEKITDGMNVYGDVSQSLVDCSAINSEPPGSTILEKICNGELSPPVVESLPNENIDSKIKRPTTLPEVNSNQPFAEKSTGMNFSEFLGLFNSPSVEGVSTPKQYDVAALDEAQQMASFLVDDILQMAMKKAEEKLTHSESLVEDRVEAVQVAQILVDGVLCEASAHVSCVDDEKAEISTTCDIKDSGGDYSMNSSPTEDLNSPVTDNILSTELCPGSILETTVNVMEDLTEVLHSPVTENILSSEPCPGSIPEITVHVVEEPTDLQNNMLNISEEKCALKTEQSQAVAEEFSEENSLPCNATCAETAPSVVSDNTLDNVNISEDSSLSDSLADMQSKDSVKTSSTENAGGDSSRSSLLTTSDLGLRSEASLFVDGVLQEAVKKYEESSSSESSPVKIRSLALDSEFFQEEEELATPCGEMLTEHFMDFESGRNVSVFCTIPENRNEDQLLAYDRVAHTIGNREVDSDTGKSCSVFRMEEDVFYEIQRASTCTSVFESVEEEDEDMIDTTIPVEERPERTLSTSASFPSYDKEKFGASDDPFSADCDAFEDAVGAFLSKERLAHNELRSREHKGKSDSQGMTEEQSEVTCRALVLRHPEIGISNSDEKKRMAEKWANGGESEVPNTPEMREKIQAIRAALDSEDDVAVKLCRLALTEGGLINDALRREAWPRMLGLDPTLEVDAPSLEDLKSHPEYGQVVLDVNRSLKRFPPDIPKDHRETLQDKLTRLIMYVISKHPHLRYYQGYHDVAVTFLLVVGESIAFQIMERLSTEHLSDCMQPTMERTSYLLHFIYPLLHRLHPTLADYLERSEVGTMFCLPWFLTWFGHSLDHYKDVVRLYDHFLASPPLAPLYVAAVLVAHRADEVLAVDCDMAAIHALLSHIPDSLPLEILLHDATDLYLKFPPESIEREVEERFKNEQETEARERLRALRRRRRGGSHGSGSWQLAEIHDRIGGSMMGLNRWMPPWVVQQQRLSMRLLFASATFFVGFYVYSRGGDMLPYP